MFDFLYTAPEFSKIMNTQDISIYNVAAVDKLENRLKHNNNKIKAL